MNHHAEIFFDYRNLLFAIAYRMTGQVMESEDLVQDAYLRWMGVDLDSVSNPKGFLTAMITNLCLDYLKSARVRREEYVGPWLPEPMLTAPTLAHTDPLEHAESLSLAFLTLLERLAPSERAAYLLREVFSYGYDEVATVLGKSEAACRQMVSRARSHLEEGRPRFDVTPGEEADLLGHFLEASMKGDMAGLVSMLTVDAALYSDGGGQRTAATRPLFGVQKVATFLLGIARMATDDHRVRVARINGEPALIIYERNQVYGVMVLHLESGKVACLHNILNPDKLGAIPALDVLEGKITRSR
jgi:RNA polymerase sigma-70 factor (ECF subfamily)